MFGEKSLRGLQLLASNVKVPECLPQSRQTAGFDAREPKDAIPRAHGAQCSHSLVASDIDVSQLVVVVTGQRRVFADLDSVDGGYGRQVSS